MNVKLPFLFLVCIWNPVQSDKSNVVDLIVSFVTFDKRPTALVVPNLCWTPCKYKMVSDKTKTMVQALSPFGISVGTSLQKGRSEVYLNHILILADLGCRDAEDFLLQASKNGYFKSPYRWLLLESNGTAPEVLQRLEILVDSDVVISSKIGDDWVFVEAYKISENTEVIFTTRSKWRLTTKTIRNPDQSQQDLLNLPTIFTSLTTKIPKVSKTKVTNGVIQDYRKTKVLSARRSDLRGHVLTMANVITDSNETMKHMDDRLQLHQDSIAKMSYNVVKVCFEMLNATEKLIFANTWGYKDSKGKWNGAIERMLKKEADLGKYSNLKPVTEIKTTLTIFTLERMQVIDYIAMTGETKVRFVFREPPLAYVTNIFTLPFQGSVWIACGVCVLGCSLFLYIVSKWEASMGLNPLQLDGSWTDVIILTIGAVLQQGCTLEPRYAAGRCVTLILFVALTILFAAYSANIVVLLRASSSSVRSLPDLLHSPLQFGASDFDYNRYFFKKLNDSTRKQIYDKKIAPKGKKPRFYSMKDGVEKIRKGLFAFHMETNPGYRLIQETYKEDEKCDLVEIDYINEINPWVPGQKRSPFKDHFKINFIKIRETGIQANIQHRFTVPKPRCSGTIATFSSVGITDMLPMMLATLYGMLFAPAVLMLEILYKKLTTSRNHTVNANNRRLQFYN